MNRHARRALESHKARGTLGQVTKAVEALQSVKDLNELTIQLKQMQGTVQEAYAAVEVMATGHAAMAAEIEALRETVFKVLGPVAPDIFQEELKKALAE